METNNATFKMIQWYPFPRVLPHDDPCVTNTQPVYIEKYDRIVRIGRNLTVQKSLNSNQKEPLQNSVVPMQPIEIKENSKEVESSTLNMPRICINNSETVTNSLDDNLSKLFGPNERFTGDYLLHYDLTNIEDLVEMLIPSGETTLIAGPGDSGKTTFYFQLATAIATKKQEFIGRKINAIYYAVLIIATEDSKRRIAEKLQKQYKKISPEETAINDLIIHISGDNLFNRLKIELKHKKFDLVVLDAMADLLKDDILAQKPVRDFYEELEKLTREFGTTFLIIHHVNKTPGNFGRSKILGSVAIVDRARNVLMFDKDIKSGLRFLTIEKSNNLSDNLKGKPIQLKFDQETLTYSLATPYLDTKSTNSETIKVAENKKVQQSAQEIPLPFLNRGKSKPGRKLDWNTVLKARELRTQGMTEEKIGKILGKNKSTICRWFKDHPTYDLSKDDSN